jgi:hypothetical protein
MQQRIAMSGGSIAILNADSRRLEASPNGI